MCWGSLVAFDTWTRWLLAICDLNDRWMHLLIHPKLVNRTCFSGVRLTPKLSTTTSSTNKNHPGFFATFIRTEVLVLFVRPGSHKILFYPETLKGTLSKKQHLKHIMILPNSVFIVHALLQRAGNEWHVKHFLHYYIYLTLESVELLIAFSFAYGTSLSIVADREKKEAEEGMEEIGGLDDSFRSYEVQHTVIPEAY